MIAGIPRTLGNKLTAGPQSHLCQDTFLGPLLISEGQALSALARLLPGSSPHALLRGCSGPRGPHAGLDDGALGPQLGPLSWKRPPMSTNSTKHSPHLTTQPSSLSRCHPLAGFESSEDLVLLWASAAWDSCLADLARVPRAAPGASSLTNPSWPCQTPQGPAHSQSLLGVVACSEGPYWAPAHSWFLQTLHNSLRHLPGHFWKFSPSSSFPGICSIPSEGPGGAPRFGVGCKPRW